MKRHAAFLIPALSLIMIPTAVHALERVEQQHADFPSGFVTRLVRVTITAGETVPLHTHPGIEIGYIQAGDMMLSIAGQPDRKLSAGESFTIPVGAAHGVHNLGATPLVILATYVVDPAKPLATPFKP